MQKARFNRIGNAEQRCHLNLSGSCFSKLVEVTSFLIQCTVICSVVPDSLGPRELKPPCGN